MDEENGLIPNQVLSPLFFILYMDLLIEEVHGINDNDKQFILEYTDDVAQSAVKKEESEKCMNTCSFTKCQLKLNLVKTEVIVFNRTPSQVRIVGRRG